MKKNVFSKLLPLVLILCMVLPQMAMAAVPDGSTCYIEVSITDNVENNEVSGTSSQYLTGASPLAIEVVSLIQSKYAELKVFGSPAMRDIMNEGLSAFSGSGDAWTTFLNTYISDVSGDFKNKLKDKTVTLNDLVPDTAYSISFENEEHSDPKFGTVYTVTVTLKLNSSGGSEGGSGGSGGSGGGGASSSTSSTTTKNEDGSTTTTTTNKATGTVTEVTTHPDGSSTTVVTEKDGSVTVNSTVSSEAIAEAAKNDTVVTLPMNEVTAGTASETIPEVSIDLPANSGEVTVEIPVADITPGTIAIIVNADGTETVVPLSAMGENGLMLTLTGDATVKIVDNSKEFSDVSANDWEAAAVAFVSARNIMGSTGGDNFDSIVPTTRAMVWTMLARLSGVDTSPAPGQDWWEAGRKWAMENGISDGTNGDNPITREQLATMLWRFVGSPDHDHTIDHFHDHHETSDWARAAKEWAVGNGVINGKGSADGTLSLDPLANASRGEVAQMIMNFIQNVCY